MGKSIHTYSLQNFNQMNLVIVVLSNVMNLYHSFSVMSVYWIKLTNKRVKDAPKGGLLRQQYGY